MLYGSQMASHMNINKQSWNVMKLKGNWRILTHKHIARWLKHGAPNQRHETALLICSQAFVCKKTRYCRDIIQQCCSPTCNKTIFCMVLVWHLSALFGGWWAKHTKPSRWHPLGRAIHWPSKDRSIGNVSNPKVVPTTCFAQLDNITPWKTILTISIKPGEKMLYVISISQLNLVNSRFISE
jgi:hypothetical protein